MYYDKYIKIVFQSTQLSTLETIIYGWKLKQEDEQNLASISKQTQLLMIFFYQELSRTAISLESRANYYRLKC